MIYLAKYSLSSGPVSQICLFWFGQIKKKNECKVVAGKRNKKKWKQEHKSHPRGLACLSNIKFLRCQILGVLNKNVTCFWIS